MKLLEIIIYNGISPTYDLVYQDLLLLLGFLILTMAIEAGAFWFIFRKKVIGEEGSLMLFKMIMIILVLNFVTFLFGAAIYMAVS